MLDLRGLRRRVSVLIRPRRPSLGRFASGMLQALLWSSAALAQDPAAAPPAPPTPKPDTQSAPASRPVYPDDPRLAVVVRLLQSGDPENAAVTCRAVLAAKPDCDRAAMLLGVSLSKAKRYDEARAQLERGRDSTQAFPERKHANHFLGWACYHLGELDAARAAFESHLKEVPREPDSTFGLGLIALDEDRLDEADARFDEALEGFSKPKERGVDLARVLTRKADVALRRDDVVAAEALLARAVKASAVQHETWSKIARVKDRLGKTAEADAARANVERILEALGRRSSPQQAEPKPPASDSPVEQPAKEPR